MVVFVQVLACAHVHQDGLDQVVRQVCIYDNLVTY